MAVDPVDTGQTAAHLLDDFSEALAVYARLGGDPVPEIVRGEPTLEDALVIGCAAEVGDEAARLVGSLAAGTRVYALVATEACDPSQAAASFEQLKDLCREANLAWEGGLAVGGARLRDAVRHTPRMGWLRRDLSEKVDQLVLAVRCGTPVGTLESKPPVPRWAWRALIGIIRRRGSQAGSKR